MTNEEIKAMLEQNTKMSAKDIRDHIKDGVFVYESREEVIQELVNGLMDREDAEATADDMEQMTFNGHTYYVDFAL